MVSYQLWKRFLHYMPFYDGNPPSDSTQGPVMQSLDVFFVFSLNKLLNKHSSRLWYETSRRSCHVTVLVLNSNLLLTFIWKQICDICAQYTFLHKMYTYQSQPCKITHKTLNQWYQGITIWPWWRHQMEAFSALLAHCVVTGEFPAQRLVTRSFNIFFDLNKRLGKQSWGWWFETPSRSLWRHCNVIYFTVLLWSTSYIFEPFFMFHIDGHFTCIYTGNRTIIPLTHYRWSNPGEYGKIITKIP